MNGRLTQRLCDLTHGRDGLESAFGCMVGQAWPAFCRVLRYVHYGLTTDSLVDFEKGGGVGGWR